jgi:hypothetical protein
MHVWLAWLGGGGGGLLGRGELIIALINPGDMKCCKILIFSHAHATASVFGLPAPPSGQPFQYSSPAAAAAQQQCLVDFIAPYTPLSHKGSG